MKKHETRHFDNLAASNRSRKPRANNASGCGRISCGKMWRSPVGCFASPLDLLSRLFSRWEWESASMLRFTVLSTPSYCQNFLIRSQIDLSQFQKYVETTFRR